jgi:hypothetical protein
LAKHFVIGLKKNRFSPETGFFNDRSAPVCGQDIADTRSLVQLSDIRRLVGECQGGLGEYCTEQGCGQGLRN